MQKTEEKKAIEKTDSFHERLSAAVFGSSMRPTYLRIVAAIEDAIRNGYLRPGERVPSQRELSRSLKLSRTSVTHAFEELRSRGVLKSFAGSGTFVASLLNAQEGVFAWRARARPLTDSVQLGLSELVDADSQSDTISFAAGTPAPELFPIKAFRSLTDQLFRRDNRELFSVGSVLGMDCLRRSVADRCGVSPDNVLILSGAQQGLDLLSRCLLDQNDAVVVDSPTYVGALQCFRDAGAKILPWEVCQWDLDLLERWFARFHPKLLYLNPTFNNPTSALMPLSVRTEVIELANRYDVPIVEDDVYRDLYLDVSPPPSLYELDRHGIVAQLRTLSKTVAPGLRLGWLLASREVIAQLARIKLATHLFSDGLIQAIGSEFLSSGMLDRHLAEVRQEHSRRFAILDEALRSHFVPGELSWLRPSGGLYTWVKLAQGSSGELLRNAMRHGVTFAKGSIFSNAATDSDKFRLCFTSQPPERIREGVARLARAMKSLPNVCEELRHNFTPNLIDRSLC